MSKNNANNPFLLPIDIGDVASDQTFNIGYLDSAHVLKKAKILDAVGVAASNTHKVKVQIKAGSDVVCEFYTQAADEGALTAGVWANFPETEVSIAAGSKLTVVIDVSGTGELNDSMIQLELYKL